MIGSKAIPDIPDRVLVINDLSGHSHTSLLAIIPIMNAMEISVTALPTAILSSNTEQKGFQMIDLTPHLEKFLSHWSELKLSFAAIYSGFICSEKQVEIVIKAINMFQKSKPLIVIDPVMADKGQLYPCFGKNIIKSMQTLIKKADLITPNLTEAIFLLNEPYLPNPDLNQAKDWCRRLAEFGPNQVLITNVPVKNKKNQTSVICYDRNSNKFHRALCRFLPVNYPGTGDIFTCVITCLLLKGMDFFPAVDKTVRFISKAIELTLANKTPANEGICLEQALKLLPKT